VYFNVYVLNGLRKKHSMSIIMRCFTVVQ